ncbi:MAG: cell division/cell wall cluster transcriptional repressor MraZ [Fimbriimonadaceae bacterium]
MSAGTLPLDFKPLIGTETANIDDKGRVLISKKKRERLGDSCALVLGKGCLILYPTPIWRQLIAEIFAVPTLNPAREAYTRLVLSAAEDDLRCDPQGRMVIPKELREKARIRDRDTVLLIGCGDRVEIWAEREWEFFQRSPDDYEKGRRELFEKVYDAMARATRVETAVRTDTVEETE